ncbi:MAG TPA: hypothetical protein VE913_23130 [Longimicrobium sp.]|nr:hypothetical protein [Longimicrobium sp.]
MRSFTSRSALPPDGAPRAAAERREDEGWRVRKDSARFCATVVVIALRDAMGTLVGFAKVARDLTERRPRGGSAQGERGALPPG